MKQVWEALHSYPTVESDAYTISLHKTRKGAEKVIKESKVEIKKEYDADTRFFRKTETKKVFNLMYADREKANSWRELHWWGIKKTSILS